MTGTGLTELIVAMIEDGSSGIESLGTIKQQEWVSGSNSISYYAAFCMEKDAAEWLENRLVERYYGSDDTLQEILRQGFCL